MLCHVEVKILSRVLVLRKTWDRKTLRRLMTLALDSMSGQVFSALRMSLAGKAWISPTAKAGTCHVSYVVLRSLVGIPIPGLINTRSRSMRHYA